MNEWLILGILVIIIIIVVFAYYKTIKKAAKLILQNYLGMRYDDDNTLYYFKYNDFENLKQEKFVFNSNGLELMGYKYFSDTVESNKKAIVFFHGLGVGHIQYTTEIDYYAKKGYIVYTFDGQGCLESKGTGLNYFTNFVKNGDDFIRHIEVFRDYKNSEIIFMGHSLGAYTSLVLSSLNKDKVKKVVAFAPFENIEILLNDQLIGALGKLSSKLSKEMAKLELKNGQKYYHSVSSILKDSSIDTLILFGDKDQILSYERNSMYFKKAIEEKDNKFFVTVKDRTHRPNLSLKGTEYDTYRIQEFDKIKKTATPEELKAYYESLDYKILVEMDKEVMDLVDDFLVGNNPSEKEIILG